MLRRGDVFSLGRQKPKRCLDRAVTTKSSPLSHLFLSSTPMVRNTGLIREITCGWSVAVWRDRMRMESGCLERLFELVELVREIFFAGDSSWVCTIVSTFNWAGYCDRLWGALGWLGILSLLWGPPGGRFSATVAAMSWQGLHCLVCHCLPSGNQSNNLEFAHDANVNWATHVQKYCEIFHIHQLMLADRSPGMVR